MSPADPQPLRVSRAEHSTNENKVEHLSEARTFFQKRNIHPRRLIPAVAEGEYVHDAAPTPALALRIDPSAGLVRAGAQALAAPPINILRKTQLPQVAAQNTASHVGEPSVAAHGNVVFFTGNWYAALSTDGGATFVFIDPYHSFPSPPGMQFCCDQIAHYIPTIDTFVWLLQYDQDASGKNIQRIAYGTTAQIVAGHWRTFDITPASLGFANDFLDFPDLAVGTNMLYVTTNVFRGQPWIASAIVRIPLAGLASGNVTAEHAISSADFNFRVAQGCDTTAYWGTHVTTSQIRVYSWPENATNPTFRNVNVAQWVAGPYQSLTPDNNNWLGRADRRMTAATKRGNELWFGWTANQGGANHRPHPYAQIARVDATTFALIDNVNLWDPSSAIAYPAMTTGANNDVAAVYTIGGGGLFPAYVVAFLTTPALHLVVESSVRGPKGDNWGDYLTVRGHDPDGGVYAAAGFTLQAGSGTQDATPHYVAFRR